MVHLLSYGCSYFESRLKKKYWKCDDDRQRPNRGDLGFSELEEEEKRVVIGGVSWLMPYIRNSLQSKFGSVLNSAKCGLILLVYTNTHQREELYNRRVIYSSVFKGDAEASPGRAPV
ncbi:uncharacterized protein LOC133745153 isoform X1 [Rosa rugosa]|uniref:uncharacterized protein LOC133745153 isoform X1 n=1 Tax=Rosa rugosa TaxID=74645 RepID=UPI002B409B35|nr:uncharacterized protein LOC133745153 isoform X1 [Rosa rugosa]